MSRISLLLVAMAACFSSIHPVWSQSRLPDGNVVEPLNSGHNELRRSEWRDVVGRKLGFGAPLSRDWSVASAKHLVQNLPKTMKPPATMNPGSVEVSIEESDGTARRACSNCKPILLVDAPASRAGSMT